MGRRPDKLIPPEGLNGQKQLSKDLLPLDCFSIGRSNVLAAMVRGAI